MVGADRAGPRIRRSVRGGRLVRGRLFVRDERGSGTMLMIGVMIVITVLALAGTCIATYAAAVHQARSAADLAALSAAVAQTAGGDPCDAAKTIARANGTKLTRCDPVGDRIDFVITVRVERAVPRMLAGLPAAVGAEAHAGPVGPSP